MDKIKSSHPLSFRKHLKNLSGNKCYLQSNVSTVQLHKIKQGLLFRLKAAFAVSFVINHVKPNNSRNGETFGFVSMFSFFPSLEKW